MVVLIQVRAFGITTASMDRVTLQREHGNPYANDPPVIVDQNGKYYGRLSLNRYHPELGIGAKLYDWLKGDVCGQ